MKPNMPKFDEVPDKKVTYDEARTLKLILKQELGELREKLTTTIALKKIILQRIQSYDAFYGGVPVLIRESKLISGKKKMNSVLAMACEKQKAELVRSQGRHEASPMKAEERRQ